MKRRIVLGLIGLVMLLITLSACNGSTSEATPTPPEPHALLQTVIANLRQTQTFKLLIEQTGAPYIFLVTLDSGATQVSAIMQRAEGQYVYPNILYATTRLKVSGLPPINVEIFARGVDQWFKLVSSPWINFPVAEGFDPGRLIQADSGFPKALSELEGLTYVETTTLPSGAPAHHVKGLAKGQVINDLMFGLLSIEQENIGVDVFIDQQTNLPAQLTVVLPQTATPDEPQDTTWTIEVYDVNAEPDVVYPDGGGS